MLRSLRPLRSPSRGPSSARSPLSLRALGALGAHVALAGLVVACGGAPEGSATTGEGASAIIRGEASTDAQNAVVLLVTLGDSGIGQCTGTLIAPNLVLTARHCVSATRDEGVACRDDGTPIAGGKITRDKVPSSIYVITGLDRPTRPEAQGQGAKLFVSSSDNLCNNDIALVLLKAPVKDAMIAPIRLDAPANVDETLTAVGWGVTEKTPETRVRMQRTGVPITAVGSNQKTQTGPNEFSVGESICSGDSGGPAFSETGGGIIGVVSRGGNGTQPTSNPASSCLGSYASNIYTGLNGFRDLILDAFAEAGAEPWLEGEGDPRLAKDGEACTAPAACCSNVCLGGKCTPSCAKKACAAGLVCQESGGAKACVPPPPPGGEPGATTTTTTGCSSSPAPGTAGQGLAAIVAASALVAGARRRRRTPR
ncbi:MAG TPA: trypsin-like serine protease [Polyangiaceae bacterium]|nr:trypsin-like serine protease [Polyangiaceae bacterium]